MKVHYYCSQDRSRLGSQDRCIVVRTPMVRRLSLRRRHSKRLKNELIC